MPGTPGRSGGHNRLTVEQHAYRGTLRRDRHFPPTASAPVLDQVSPADRRRVLRGLRGEARRVALRLLAEYADWDTVRLLALRSFALSCERLRELEAAEIPDIKQLHRELRVNAKLRSDLALREA